MAFATRTVSNPKFHRPQRTDDVRYTAQEPHKPKVFTRPPPHRTEAVLRTHKAALARVGIDEISSLGKLTLGGNVAPSPGVLRPQPSIVRGSGLFQSAYRLSPVAEHSDQAFVPIAGTIHFLAAEPLHPVMPDVPVFSLVASSDLKLDTAYVVADEIELEAGTNVVAMYPNLSYVFICRRLTVHDDVTFTWERPVPHAESLPRTPGKPGKRDPLPASTTISGPPEGTVGEAGRRGGDSPHGADAPAFEIWTDELVGSPAVDLAGQGYDPNLWPCFEGGRGGDGGDGGDGARGRPATLDGWGFCKSGPGYGGNGGRGGRAGDGGNGGNGGNGGTFSLYAPQPVISAFQRKFSITVHEGIGGPGGQPGMPGEGGRGGNAGSNPHGCQPSRDAGADGIRGEIGQPGRAGANGIRGSVTMEAIDADAITQLLLEPAISHLTPDLAREGDSITVQGVNFSASDVALVDGVAAPTSMAGGTFLRFTMPPVEGGRRRVQVRQCDGTLSNVATIYHAAFVGSAVHADGTPSIGGRLTPGAAVQLNGSGFAAGMRVLVGGQDMPDVTVLDSHSARFTLVRPVSAPRNADGEPVTLQVALPEASPSSVSNVIQIVLDTFVMLVAGDSIAWGQGLEENEKYHTAVERTLREKHGGIGIYKAILAHSGAVIGLHPADDQPLPAVDGEIPTSYPTIPRQFTLSPFRQEDVDLILVDGGINDVDVRTILNPLTTAATICNGVETVCHGDMLTVLSMLVQTFPNAPIIVTGYYEILSSESDVLAVDALLMGLGLELGFIGGAIVGGVIAQWALDKILANCATFASQANARLRQAVDEANATLPPGQSCRVFFADPTFGPENAALAPQSFLFGINATLSAQDPLAASRAAACEAHPDRVRSLAIAKLASIGHPNPRGAEAYARAVLAQIELAARVPSLGPVPAGA